MISESQLHPDLSDTFRFLPVLPYYHRSMIPFGRTIYNASSGTKVEFGVSVKEYSVEHLCLRVFEPLTGSNGAAVLWIHGGGFVAGTTQQVNDVASRFARWLSASIVTVEYRWAPRDPFPAALDDVFHAWQWILEQEVYDNDRIAILGQSAGGGLAASLVQRIHDEGGPQPVAQVLHYPMLDDRTAANRQLDKNKYKLWTNHVNRVAWNAYLGGHEAGATSLPQYASAARRKDLSDLPPTWLGVGTFDLFYKESKSYAERLETAGVEVETHYVPGAPHVFEVMASDWKGSTGFLEATRRFLKRHLRPAKS
ncbi:alpha/beta hydrolase [Cognatishimia activa]|uniref:alpha/beta hydrolase n=1 Tax=Cognatishimia activa TaxID=1715691 RepID=UPI00222FE12C|nr:alpha/beta hydrolase [Cognatishimia activa]UZD91472.1 alpha/beta hydrolase [Cognatishimia activa]